MLTWAADFPAQKALEGYEFAFATVFPALRSRNSPRPASSSVQKPRPARAKIATPAYDFFAAVLPSSRSKINGEEEPVLLAATAARTAVISSARAMIAQLHWADFEIMVELIFARGGWQRHSTLGGTSC